MSVDPYHAVQSEIQSSLQTASTLHSSFLRIRSTAREESEELNWARNELKAALAGLDADLEDLEQSVQVVEETGARMFGIDEQELANRRRYVDQVNREIQSMRADISSSESKPPGPSRYTSTSRRDASPAPEDDQAEWAREEQQIMIRQQDSALDSITGTLATLAQQAGLMGQEISEHTEMLGDLESNVDNSNVKLDTAMKKLKKFIRDTEETKSGWCIGILIVILLILLLLVILL